MRNLKLTIAYDGTDYVGWQVQKNGISVQQRLEEAWLKVTRESIRITASGRTDGGVHAKAQVCGLKTESALDFNDIYRALNAETPFDISILKVEDAPAGFHAIRDAIEKTYNYQIQYGRILNPLRRRRITLNFQGETLNFEVHDRITDLIQTYSAKMADAPPAAK